MIDDKKLQFLNSEFLKITILQIAKSSFRQMQNAILVATDGDKDLAARLLESLMTDQIVLQKGDLAPGASIDKLKEKFQIPLNFAREVAEKGEFISIVTSDIIKHPEMPIFGNRIRKVGGEEFEFLTDTLSTIQLMHHFSFRLDELEKLEQPNNILKGLKRDLTMLKNRFEQLAAKATD